MSSFLDSISGGSDDSAQDYLKQALAQYQAIQTPSVASETVNSLPQETVQGTVNPEEIKTVDQGDTDFNNISLDPASRQAMMNALQGYQTISDDGGLDANAKLGIQQAEDAATQQARGEQGAIQQQAQAMGQGGGDFALTQRAIAAQGASNTAATQGLQQAAEAEANREAALAGLSQVGGQINSSDYSQAAQKAAAQDAITASNTAAKNTAATNNVSNNLTGQQFNVSTAQGVNAANTAAGQNQVYYNANLPQQQFNNELQKANGAAGVNQSQASTAQQAAANQSAFTGKLLGTAGTVAGAALGGPVGAAIGSQVGNITTGGTAANANKQAQNTASAFAKGGVCYAKGGAAMPHDHSICMKMGGAVVARSPEEAAEVPGNSPENDKIPASLSEGELVIPREVPKTGPAMEAFARRAPVNGDPKKKVDLTTFMHGYKKGK